MSPIPPAYLITGIQAAGKTTVAQALAERLPEPSVHVHGDQFRRWIVRGRRDMSPEAGEARDAALAQLRLRYRLAAAACDGYVGAGFSVVLQDVALGAELPYLIRAVRVRPLHVVVLAPRADVVVERESARGKGSYHRWSVDQLDRGLRRDTPRVGLWLDTSALTVGETVAQILARSGEAVIEG